MRKLFVFLFIINLSQLIQADIITIEPGSEVQEKLQEALILAKSGDTIQLVAGIYDFSDGLSLDIDDVVIQGAGMQNTILSFSEQKSGAQGLLVTSNGVILKDFAVEDTKGDAIKVIGSNGIYMINLRAEWTQGPKSTNGAYGFYPVESKNVLIDGCIAIGASDAGIYVGQSDNIIVRNNLAQYNVAGIEIENSFYADVYDNIATHNSGGILVFDLPNLPQQGGHHVRVFRNKVVDNDTDNFAPAGNIVGEVPRGTGIIIMANSDVEIFANEISGNGTVNIAIVSFGDSNEEVLSNDLYREKEQERYTNKNYYPHPKSIQVHGNKFGSSGFDPDVEKEVARILADLSNGDMPDIFWDGVLPFFQMIFGQPKDEKLVMRNNGDASFLAINPVKFFFSISDPITRKQEIYQGKIKPLSPVTIDIPEEL